MHSTSTAPTLSHTQEVISCDALIDKLLHRYGRGKLSIRKILDIVNAVFHAPITERTIQERLQKLQAYRAQLQKLLEIPQVDQRTEAWYAMRQTMITASDFAQALGKSDYGGTLKRQQKDFYVKKCGYEDISANAFTGTALKWGTMYEDVALKLYQKFTGYKVHEFGLIPHPNVNYFGASPDAINEYGIMIEIKCPLSRQINGTYPNQYYFQMQGQMDVCGLSECDFVECQLKEFADPTEFWDTYDEGVYERGIVLEYKDAATKYIYSDVGLSKEVLLSWLAQQQTDKNNIYVPHFWQLELMNTMRVYHDPDFVRTHLQELGAVWDNVVRYRADKDAYLKEVGAVSKKQDTGFKGQLELKGYCMIDDEVNQILN